MKNRLFWRLFAAFSAALLCTVALSASFMVVMVRAQKQEALQSELLLQARDIALLLSEQDDFIPGFTARSPILSQAVAQKILSVRDQYACTVWLVYANGTAYSVDSDAMATQELSNENMLKALYRVLQGEEILARGLVENDANLLSIGVPWTRGLIKRVSGAVMLHISTASMKVDYADTLRNASISATVALTVGMALCLLIASSQTKPLRKINEAVREFASGNMQTRIQVQGNSETAQLANTFNHMAEELGRLEDSRRSFVASVSHELRSPLTCIRGYIEGMQDGTIASEDLPRYLQVVLQETNRLTSLVNDLLDLSRIESGSVPLSKSVFDINELIRLTVIKFETRIEKKNIGVEVQLRDEGLYVFADSARIAQVLTNLIDNAIKFLPETSGVLRLSAFSTGEGCLVSVKDNGPGIAPDDLPFIFDRFYKADKAHTSGMGTGLGLSIVKRILEQHGQEIRCLSSLNGTEFLFTLESASSDGKQKDE